MAGRRQEQRLLLLRITAINLTCHAMNLGAGLEPGMLELYKTLNEALTIPDPKSGDLGVFLSPSRGAKNKVRHLRPVRWI